MAETKEEEEETGSVLGVSISVCFSVVHKCYSPDLNVPLETHFRRRLLEIPISG
jgi:hypothetical protein